MSRYTDARDAVPTVRLAHPGLVEDSEALLRAHDGHFDAVNALLHPTQDDGTSPLFQCDLVLLSVINRSLDLVGGFLDAFDRWNLSVAAPTVRMQVDNLLRLVALDKGGPGRMTDILLSGRPLHKEQDPLAPTGKKFRLTDARLRDHARDRFPWLDLVYEKSSGWVHFSSVHVGVTIEVDDAGQVFSRFPSDTSRYTFEFLEQVLWAMNETTSGLLSIVDDFALGKASASTGWN